MESQSKQEIMKSLFGMTREELETANILDMPSEQVMRLMFLCQIAPTVDMEEEENCSDKMLE